MTSKFFFLKLYVAKFSRFLDLLLHSKMIPLSCDIMFECATLFKEDNQQLNVLFDLGEWHKLQKAISAHSILSILMYFNLCCRLRIRVNVSMNRKIYVTRCMLCVCHFYFNVNLNFTYFNFNVWHHFIHFRLAVCFVFWVLHMKL